MLHMSFLNPHHAVFATLDMYSAWTEKVIFSDVYQYVGYLGEDLSSTTRKMVPNTPSSGDGLYISSPVAT